MVLVADRPDARDLVAVLLGHKRGKSDTMISVADLHVVPDPCLFDQGLADT